MLKYKLNRKLITCTCDKCGKEFEKPLTEYNRNLKLNRHNFCSRSCSGSYNMEHSVPTDLQIQNRLNVSKYCNNRRDKYTPVREIYRRIKRRFKECTITLDDLLELWNKQNGRCAYTNLPLILPNNKFKDDIRYLASLDRIDSSKGYIKGNIQFVALPVNLMKSTMSHNVFVDYLKEIASTFVED